MRKGASSYSSVSLALIPMPGKSACHEFLEWMKTCDHLLSICSSFLSCFKFCFSKIYILYLHLPTHNIMSTYTIFLPPHPKTNQKGFPLLKSINFTIKLHIFPPYISDFQTCDSYLKIWDHHLPIQGSSPPNHTHPKEVLVFYGSDTHKRMT